jgi:hypothetical protein
MVPIVAGDRHEYRAARTLHGNGVSLGNGHRDIFCSRRLASPLHVRPGKLCRPLCAQIRIIRKKIACLLASDDDQRRLVTKSRV